MEEKKELGAEEWKENLFFIGGNLLCFNLPVSIHKCILTDSNNSPDFYCYVTFGSSLKFDFPDLQAILCMFPSYS